MSTINLIAMENPYKEMDDVLSLYLDIEDDGYKLPDLIGLESEYTFSIWHKSASENVITFNLFGTEYNVNSNTEWQKYVCTFTITALDNVDILITPQMNIETYLYEAFLSEGNMDMSWTPAPEDEDDKFAEIRIDLNKITSTVFDPETGQSKIEQTANEIRQEVSSLIKENHTVPFRYIRDWVYGNDFDDSSSWVSCQIYVDGINIAEGIEPTLIWEPEVVYDENNNLIEIEQQEPGNLNLSLYTDGKLISYTKDSVSTEGFIDEGTEVDKDSYITTTFTGEACLQLDLGEIRTDVNRIVVWHDYSEAKSYNHRFEISEDGENWVELFNSSHGTYIETADGKSYNFSDELIAAQMSTILQTIDGVSIKVNDADGRIGSLESKADSISQTVADNMDIYDTFVKETFEDFKNETQSASFAQSVIDKSGIKNTVIGELSEMGFASKLDIEQNSESWKLIFSKIGVNADEIIKNEEIAISMDSKGITVKNGDRETTLDTEGLTGKYLGNKVFWIEDDSVKTDRVYCNNGIDTESIKILPKKHIVNNTEYGMLVFIKSGGSS